MLELLLYTGAQRSSWINWIAIGLYLIGQYITGLHSGRIDPPCIRQFITVCFAAGMTSLYYASGIDKDLNHWINELCLVGIMTATMYIYAKVNAKHPKPDTEYLLTKYKKTIIPENAPEDCVICLELLTFMKHGLQCRQCKHIFHKKCIRKWCEESPNCPHCRYEYH